MKKIEVTDEMVERALDAAGKDKWDWSNHAPMRRALEAALNAPTKPEIEVTAVMIGEGHKAARNALEQRPRNYADEYIYNDRCYLTELPYTAIYRAMRKLEPPQDEQALQYARRSGFDRRKGDV
jgi:peptidoglycan/xylan/chitin deacetylase (PgdA/CDA1 family)